MVINFSFFYGIFFLATALALFYMALRNYQNVDIYYWTILLFIPIICMAHFGRVTATTIEGFLFSNNVTSLEGTLLVPIYLFFLCRIFKINLKPIFKKLIYFVTLIHCYMVWFGSFNGLYFINPELKVSPMGNYIDYSIGPFFHIHFAIVIVLSLMIFACFVYAFSHPEKCFRGTVLHYFLFFILYVVITGIQVLFKIPYSLLVFIYPIIAWMIVFSYERNLRHSIEGIISGMRMDTTTSGYVAFDMERRFLGANEPAFQFNPELRKQPLDKVLDRKGEGYSVIFEKMMNDLNNGNSESIYVDKGDIILKYKIKYLYLQKKAATAGYIFSISDDTEHQRSINFIRNYNETLKIDVRQQTAQIKEIQKTVVLGLANMIENRDSSTGGHVKRTSDVIKILIDTMIDNQIGNLDLLYADNIIRAAPMHDLGKISIDNSILCKPGKLTDEEYALMKVHPIKSSEIVNYILKDVEEMSFVNVAYNVARYHHERWDGRGYPDQLSGNEIPFEARIMAVADVYDALVSKRCYKEPMSFEEAAKVMIENMGTQFDPKLKEVFELSRYALESYYNQE